MCKLHAIASLTDNCCFVFFARDVYPWKRQAEMKLFQLFRGIPHSSVCNDTSSRFLFLSGILIPLANKLMQWDICSWRGRASFHNACYCNRWWLDCDPPLRATRSLCGWVVCPEIQNQPSESDLFKGKPSSLIRQCETKRLVSSKCS